MTGRVTFLLVGLLGAAAEALVLDGGLYHLRAGDTAEWSTFSETPRGPSYDRTFESRPNDVAWTLQWRQQDVKTRWRVQLNGVAIGSLLDDEQDQLHWLAIPPGTIQSGENQLTILPHDGGASKVDDIRVGEFVLHPRPAAQVYSESAVAFSIRDGDSGALLPGRLTITRPDGVRAPLGSQSDASMAIRTGVVYTGTGAGRVMLPAGHYEIYGGRGFEYSLAHQKVTVAPGAMATVDLTVRREVPTEGYVACDPHIHTVTHSGHGDATMEERMITLVGEGIELPIATDHNVHVDYEAMAKKLGLRTQFTPVVGNEVTTSVGHFNIFPIADGAPVPDASGTHWDEVFRAIHGTPGVRAVILNHARDIHGGFRPFGPTVYDATTGANRNGWRLQANAMEIINSGATQSDPLQLTRDWMTQLNRGHVMTPVGSSDSHDVTRYIVGQGRTYIRVDDRDPGKIDVDAAMDAFVAGQVTVSYGLLVEMTVNERYRSGDVVPLDGDTDELTVDIRVLGPHWVEADRVQLYQNGELVRGEAIARGVENPTGVIWTGRWSIARPEKDAHLVAIATGPGIDGPWWPMAKPYQPTTPDFEARAFGCSGAVWIDADGDGQGWGGVVIVSVQRVVGKGLDR